MRRLFSLVLVGLLGLTGCRESSTESARANLSAPAELSLTTYVGGVARERLELQNNGRASAPVVTQLGAPFQVQPEQFELAGGATVSLEVTLTGLTDGLFTERLRITSQDETREVLVHGTVLKPPRCDEEAVCATSVFSPDEGLCELRNAPDGTACDAACLSGGQCQNGTCTGVPVNCEDENACTVDACEVASGCVHTPRSCPAPEDPCLVAVCDPLSGCGTVEAPDGTSCGPAECTAARVCIAGACVTQTLPEGAACGESTPCQARGTCINQECVRPPAVPLPVEWELTSKHPVMQFHGHMDSQENLYWLETANNDEFCDLVSSTSAGVIRFRATAQLRCPQYLESLSLGADQVVIAADESRIEARSTMDGSFRWARSLEADLVGFPDRICPDGSVNGRLAWPRGMARASDESLLMLVTAYSRCGNDVRPSESFWILSYSSSGSRLWSRRVVGYHGGWELKLDREDGIYMEAGPDLLAFDRSGGSRWTVPHGGLELLAVEGESLFLGGYGVPLREHRRSDGAFVRELPLPYASLLRKPMVANLQGGFLPLQENGEVRLAHFERASASLTRTEPLWLSWSTPYASDMHLTREGRLLMGIAPSGVRIPDLFEVTPEGEVTLRCALDAPDGMTRGQGGSALGQERWFFSYESSAVPRLRAYRLPGRSPATNGWVNRAGSTTRTFSPK